MGSTDATIMGESEPKLALGTTTLFPVPQAAKDIYVIGAAK
jgi:hypothetical protein